MIRLFKKMKGQVAKAITPLLAPYLVLVYSEDALSIIAKHYAWSTIDAQEWMACYDATDHIEVHSLFKNNSFAFGRFGHHALS